MNKPLLLVLFILASVYSYAQTNTFPTSGNVGIGTLSPENSEGWQKALEVKGNLSSKTLTSTNTIITGTWAHNLGIYGAMAGGIAGTFTNHPYSFITNKLTRMVISTNGNVGIGTSIPNGRLDVNGAILLPGSNDNVMLRPVLSATRITGEIAGYRGSNMGFDDGFLRVSAGGGTNANTKTFIDLSGYSNVPDMDRNITFGTSGAERMRITNSGYVGIGTKSPKEALSVNGNIRSRQIKVETANWPDYVFEANYDLSSLASVKAYVDKNKHLPDMPSEQEVTKNGLNLGEIVKIQMQKIEELTLYLIEKDKEVKDLQNEMNQLKMKQQIDQEHVESANLEKQIAILMKENKNNKELRSMVSDLKNQVIALKEQFKTVADSK